jgi:glutathionyl-hydroquinone reductase
MAGETEARPFQLDGEIVGGEWVRQQSIFRRWVGGDELPPEAGRYHLYVARACPWSHRSVIVRRLKGLEDAIGISYLDPYRDERGWRFTGGPFVDEVNGFEFLSEAYRATDPDYDGRVSVPVLWDRRTQTIVSNESADVVRMLATEFDAVARAPELDLYPEPLRAEIDELNDWIYEDVNNGVYRAGFSMSQRAYEQRFTRLFDALERLDALLAERRYLTGDRITEADWRLFPTLVRFDPVYHTHFRCNGRRLIDHPNLWAYARELYQLPGIADTVAMDEIKRHYYTTHDDLNPKRIIPLGPLGIDWWAPHGRG